MDPWIALAPTDMIPLGEKVGYSWITEERTINDLYVWHDCDLVLDSKSVAPGARFGWRPGGVRAHTLVQVAPLTITASVYWPECCGLHGFITNGKFDQV